MKIFINTLIIFFFLFIVSISIYINRHNTKDNIYQDGFVCGVIVAKMNILTDTGTGEYKRLSDKYFKMNCYGPDRDGIDIVEYIEKM